MIYYFKLLLILTFVNIIVTLLFVLFTYIRIKIKNLDYWDIIKIKQLYISSILSTYIWGIFPIIVGALVWIVAFVILRFIIFNSDSFRLSKLYEDYQIKEMPYPLVESPLQIKSILKYSLAEKINITECYYGVLQHSYSGIILLILSLFSIVAPVDLTTNIAMYITESLIIAIVLAILIGILSFRLTYYEVTSYAFGSLFLSVITVIFVEVIYCFIVIVILGTILLNHNTGDAYLIVNQGTRT